MWTLFKLLFWFTVYSLIHDVVVKYFYCKWKKRKNNGYKCYYWNCKEFHNCPYNGEKRRNVFGFLKGE